MVDGKVKWKGRKKARSCVEDERLFHFITDALGHRDIYDVAAGHVDAMRGRRDDAAWSVPRQPRPGAPVEDVLALGQVAHEG